MITTGNISRFIEEYTGKKNVLINHVTDDNNTNFDDTLWSITKTPPIKITLRPDFKFQPNYKIMYFSDSETDDELFFSSSLYVYEILPLDRKEALEKLGI